MATKKKTEEETAAEVVADKPKFTKRQFVNSRTFARYRDYLNAQLKDGVMYTKTEVADMIEKAFKVKISI